MSVGRRMSRVGWPNGCGSTILPRLFSIFLLLPPLFLRAQPGALDKSFDPGTGVDQSVYSIVVQTNGSILIAGNFTSFNTAPRTNIARLYPGGSGDPGFDPGPASGGSFPYVNALGLQADGMVLLGGSFTNAAATNLARLNTNGTLDTSFTSQADDTVNALVVQTNGSVVIGGFFTHVNGRARTGIARLGANGVLDLNFNLSLSGGFATVYALALQPDGEIVLGGSFTNVNSTARTNIARLLADGTLDANFKPVSVGGGQLSPAAIYALAVDGKGRVLAGGDFTSVNGLVRTNLVRLNGDGSLDTNFYAAAGTDFAVNSLAVQSDDKVLMGGYFDLVNGVSRNYIARLNADGRLDTTFEPGSGASDVVYSVALQSDGKVLIGGAFTDFDGTARNGIARLIMPGPQLVNSILSNNVFKVSVDTVNGKNYTLEYKNSLADSDWTALPVVPGDGTVKMLMDSSATDSHRFYRVEVQ